MFVVVRLQLLSYLLCSFRIHTFQWRLHREDSNGSCSCIRHNLIQSEANFNRKDHKRVMAKTYSMEWGSIHRSRQRGTTRLRTSEFLMPLYAQLWSWWLRGKQDIVLLVMTCSVEKLWWSGRLEDNCSARQSVEQLDKVSW